MNRFLSTAFPFPLSLRALLQAFTYLVLFAPPLVSSGNEIRAAAIFELRTVDLEAVALAR